MATESITAIDQCKVCINSHKSFVLQGGAGSGKTESLKELLLYIQNTNPTAKVICITHTNAAVDEIISRVGDQYTVSTIHSFLHRLIGKYKNNIKTVIDQLFHVPTMVRNNNSEYILDKDYKKEEFDRYKKTYKKYTGTLYSKYQEDSDPVCGKRDYDKDPYGYNQHLNEKINVLNARISSSINEKDSTSIYYNETKFDHFQDLSYGHDGLLAIFHLLFEKYPLLGKIIADQYDYIFIDEYQDTQDEVLSDLLTLPSQSNLTIGLFGDSMQTIYEEGIGDVDNYINNGTLKLIPKSDNYRCSYEIIDFINPLRTDGIRQNVAFKELTSGRMETIEERHGIASVRYIVVDQKPTSYSPESEKEQYRKLIDEMISKALETSPSAKILILTNKAVAEKNGFEHLYQVFNARYSNVTDQIENYLQTIQALDIGEICNFYLHKDFNTVIKLVRQGGYTIRTMADKTALHDIIFQLVENTDLSIHEAIEQAIDLKLIKRSETLSTKQSSNNHFLETIASNPFYQTFKKLYLGGSNTYSKIKKVTAAYSEEIFNEYQHQLKKEQFIAAMRSHELKFSEVLNYIKYLNEETKYITMHKTKGTSIPSVIAVMEEFFWNSYDFSLLYRDCEVSTQITQKKRSQNLIYVACSRARENLICLRILTHDEIDIFKQYFPNAEELILSQ